MHSKRFMRHDIWICEGLTDNARSNSPDQMFRRSLVDWGTHLFEKYIAIVRDDSPRDISTVKIKVAPILIRKFDSVLNIHYHTLLSLQQSTKGQQTHREENTFFATQPL